MEVSRFVKLAFLKQQLCFYKQVSKCSSSYESIFHPKEKKQVMERLNKFKIDSNVSSSRKKAAVLIPLCHVNNEVSLLYTLRKRDLKRHKGQVSFPGGKQDSGDSNLETTALRETEEELGIQKASVDVWGCGNGITGKEFKIYPVIGYIGNISIKDLRPNPSEVDYAFTVPLNHFFNPKNFKFTQYRNGEGYILPVYINLDCRIWGITALITHIVLKALSPQKYKHELQMIQPVLL